MAQGPHRWKWVPGTKRSASNHSLELVRNDLIEFHPANSTADGYSWLASGEPFMHAVRADPPEVKADKQEREQCHR
jgi:hypothetical protein